MPRDLSIAETFTWQRKSPATRVHVVYLIEILPSTGAALRMHMEHHAREFCARLRTVSLIHGHTHTPVVHRCIPCDMLYAVPGLPVRSFRVADTTLIAKEHFRRVLLPYMDRT